MPAESLAIACAACLLNLCAFLGHLGDRDTGTSRTREGLDSHDLEVVGVAKPVLGPVVEVVGGGDGAGGALALAHAPVLGEGAGARD